MPMYGFIVDFCCLSAKVVVEVEGDSHARAAEADAQRDKVLAGYGYQVLRFSNLDVAESLEAVLARILAACRNPPLAPP
jgi:very-short-patch-repair endonuclease